MMRPAAAMMALRAYDKGRNGGVGDRTLSARGAGLTGAAGAIIRHSRVTRTTSSSDVVPEATQRMASARNGIMP